MKHIRYTLALSDWRSIAASMHEQGYALLPGILKDEDCEALKAAYNDPVAYRKTVVMERYRFGLGEYKYFDYPLPGIIQSLRTSLYSHLAGIANTWFDELNIKTRFPDHYADFLQQCHEHGQNKATPLILKYGPGGYNTLHQDLYGEVYFPIQAMLMLSEPVKDFTGGEFVLTQQMPRAQSKAIVLNPGKGDLLLFTTHLRPVKGSRGFYRSNMKHGVSEVRSGSRHTLGIIFHDATS